MPWTPRQKFTALFFTSGAWKILKLDWTVIYLIIRMCRQKLNIFAHDSRVVSVGKLSVALKSFGYVVAEWLSK